MRIPYSIELLIWDIKEKGIRRRIPKPSKQRRDWTNTLNDYLTIESIIPIILGSLLCGIFLQVLSVPYISSSTYQMIWLQVKAPQIVLFWGYVIAFIIGFNWIVQRMKIVQE